MDSIALLDAIVDEVAEAISLACGRPWNPEGDPEMYLYYRRAAMKAMNALKLTEEERSYYDHAEPYSTGYEYRLVSPWRGGGDD